MANRFVQAPSHGGAFRAGKPRLIIIHSLEAPARKGLAYDLATGWIQTAGVSPHAMTDPGETVDLLSEDTVGWHCGNGNQEGVGFEHTGYAAWSFEQWTTGDAFAAVRLGAKRAAEAAKRHDIPLRWLSLSQIRNGERGFCTHADISATLGGTNHTDPGPGFPYAIFMQMVQQFAGGWDGIRDDYNPNPQPGTSGGAQPKGFLMALSDEQQNDLYNKVNFLYNGNHIEGTGYGRTEAGFNDLRELRKVVDQIGSMVAALYNDNKIDGYPYGKQAAGFNDVRALAKVVDELKAAVDALPKAA